MNDTLIQMVASQLGIPAAVLAELKATRPELVDAEIDPNETLAVLTVHVQTPTAQFPILITIPVAQLKRFPAIYGKVVSLATPKS